MCLTTNGAGTNDNKTKFCTSFHLVRGMLCLVVGHFVNLNPVKSWCVSKTRTAVNVRVVWSAVRVAVLFCRALERSIWGSLGCPRWRFETSRLCQHHEEQRLQQVMQPGEIWQTRRQPHVAGQFAKGLHTFGLKRDLPASLPARHRASG